MKPDDITKRRQEAARRRRRIVFHSDGIPWDNRKMMFPNLPGTQADACTYSLMHQFNLARLYRTAVAQEWPAGDIRKRYGDGPDGLEHYVDFCHAHGHEAFWAMRWNDTHDAGGYDDARWKLKNNQFKQAHPELLVGTQDRQPPHGRWTSVDYTHPEVREQAFRIWEEVCTRYDIDGIKLDAFRHPTFFKSVAWGQPIKDEEVDAMTDLIRRTRAMMDRVGAARGRPLLLAVRAPDCVKYCREIGPDVERWMAEGLMDVWIASGYFRLNEWETSVATAHRYGVPLWACLDESRMQGDLPAPRYAAEDIAAEKAFALRKWGTPPAESKTPAANVVRNTPEAYRARALRAWDAGADAVMLFNFWWDPPDPHFDLLSEIGDPQTLARMSKVYCAYYRGRKGMEPGYWLKGGERFAKVPAVFAPESPEQLVAGERKVIDLRVAEKVGRDARVALCIQVEGLRPADDLSVTLAGEQLSGGSLSGVWLEYVVDADKVVKGTNRFEVSLAAAAASRPTLHDLQLWIHHNAQRAHP